jgi:quinohemoprotein amine dehydrogenase
VAAEHNVAKVACCPFCEGKTTLTVEGVNLPDARPAEIAFAGGAVRVLGVKRVAPGALELQVVSDADKLSEAKLTVKGIDAGTIRLAPRIDFIAITPETGRARLSAGAHYPAEGVQFEAIAYAKSGSGRKATNVALGPVPATFRLAEEKTRPDDDDLRWVGGIKSNGSYLPMGDYGPNPLRNYSGKQRPARRGHYKRVLNQAQAQLAVTLPIT